MMFHAKQELEENGDAYVEVDDDVAFWSVFFISSTL